MTDLHVIDAISEDWETYSPMTRDDVRTLVERIARRHGSEQLLANPFAVWAWGVQSALGNWDTPTALAAVDAFYAAEPRAVWVGDGPEAGEPRPVLPGDITEFVERARAAP